MLQLAFTVQDLSRTRFATSPLDHLIFGLIPQECPHYVGSTARDRWWRRVRAHVPQAAGPLMELCAASPYGLPDFLGAQIDVEHRRIGDELDAIRTVPDEQVRADLSAAYDDLYGPESTNGRIGTRRRPEPPRVIRELYDAGSDGLRGLTHAARALYTRCLAPDWPDIQRQLRADISRRMHTCAQRGAGGLLEGVYPRLSWNDGGILRYAEAPASANGVFKLGGYGLELRPSIFLEGGIGFFLPPGRQPVLFHPTGSWPGGDRSAPGLDGLTTLIGPARARALRAIGRGPCTTKELADRLGITAPSVSAHTNALRTAGAITTERHGREVCHTLSHLGHDLLATNPEPVEMRAGTEDGRRAVRQRAR
ncbi:winged helix-turn-helix domain-containing protein [Streptomyces sp. NPDC020719]|uniref:ArsR/SmtB family transcription factor n=1 Tax=Streptomyces sp. NPDC020719 TaxID=3154896 RepID=UPI0033E5CDA0